MARNQIVNLDIGLVTKSVNRKAGMSLLTTFLVSGLALSIFILGGCGEANPDDPRAKTSLVSVEGSDTLAAILEKWKEGFMDETGIPVSVQIADSGEGIRALLERTTDVAAASRDLTDNERKESHTRRIHLDRRIVALDAIAIIVNKKNPVGIDALTYGQLADLYSGRVSDWKYLSSSADTKDNTAVQIYAREPGSGTSRYFREHIFADHLKAESSDSGGESDRESPGERTQESTYCETAQIVRSNDAMVDSVAADPCAIGFVNLGLALANADRVKILKIKLVDASPPVMPSLSATVDDYPLSRPLYLFIDRNGKSNARKFVEYCAGAEGQKVVAEEGFVSPSH